MLPIQELINFKGKVAVVTGAANGIGRAIAYRLAEAGSDLYLIDKEQNGLIKTKNMLAPFDVKIETITADLSNRPEIDSFWNGIDGSKVDILVNNAGVYPFKKFMDLDSQQLGKVMEINLYSVIWMCQHMIKQRDKKGGAVVNIGSIEAIMPFKKDMVQYTLSKIGVIALTRDLAREFGNTGFRINAILPGGIISKGTKSAAWKAIFPPDFKLIADGYNFMQRIPAGRLGQPDDVAKMVLVLCSEFASYMYGALIPVDGGFFVVLKTIANHHIRKFNLLLIIHCHLRFSQLL